MRNNNIPIYTKKDFKSMREAGSLAGISRGQQSINGRLKKIDCQLIANKECYGSFTEPYEE